MKSRLLLSLFALFFAPIAAAEPLSIGVIAPLSGTAAASGETVRNGMAIAEDECNADHAAKFLFEDDQLQAKNTVTAVNALLARDVRGLVVFGTPTSLAVNDIAEKKRVPMMAFSILPKVVEGKQFVMKHWVTADAENEAVVAEVKRRGYKRVAVMTTNNDAMLALKDRFVRSSPAEVVLAQDFDRDNTDFTSTISKLRALAPDAVYVLLWAPQPGVFVRQLRTAGYQGAIFGVHNIEDPNEIAAAAGGLRGAWIVTGDDRQGAAFNAEYLRRFGKKPAAGAANAHDVACMFAAAARSGRDINAYLHGITDFHGVFGVYSATPRNDFTLPVGRKVIAASGIEWAG